MRRSPLRRFTPLRATRRTPKRSRKPRTEAERDEPAYLEFIRTLPCCAPDAPSKCFPFVQAHHHTYPRGMGQKAPDRFAIPLCALHHDNFHMANGAFLGWGRDRRRAWQDAQVERFQAAYERRVGYEASAF